MVGRRYSKRGEKNVREVGDEIEISVRKIRGGNWENKREKLGKSKATIMTFCNMILGLTWFKLQNMSTTDVEKLACSELGKN